ncbi:hypothetical protein [Glycomyces sp. MUSA5-2]|uniref:hypothetical protein n=1 Tax=Glycomyces sp. MUSA5-2 TaxID=2053002 RepID=UPI0030080144
MTSNDDILQQIRQALDQIDTILLQSAAAEIECESNAQDATANGHEGIAGYYFAAKESLERARAAASSAELEARTAELHVERTRGHGAGSDSSGAANFGGVAPPRPTDQIRDKKRKPGHFAHVRVADSSGKTLYDYDIESGNQTGQEKALGRRKGASASHTENRSVRMHGSAHPEMNDDPFFNTHPIPPGSRVEIAGTRPPCPQCKNAMKRLMQDRQANVIYKWGYDETWP